MAGTEKAESRCRLEADGAHRSRRRFVRQLAAITCAGWAAPGTCQRAGGMPRRSGLELLQRDNLVAWCIVPFDAARRSPEQRAAMLEALGLRRCAYDWRDEHVPTFEREIIAYRQRDIEFLAFWGEHEQAFRLFQKYRLHPQIWKMVAIDEQGTDEEKLTRATETLLPLARKCQTLGCSLGIYNHGGWAGHPLHMVALVEALHRRGFRDVGIIFNFHHGHEYIRQWPDLLQRMLPYLLCINLNGMNDNAMPKILPLGEGKHEVEMIRAIVQSSYAGPIGILDHRPDTDARIALEANLAGLEQIVHRLHAS
ncbi:MAG: hypothetical protein D6753_00045 [Planctomycetota bacterium]|nr:MAG: hypothetical protein D6753_00045 [Planctomycetota bacterium]